MDPCISGFDVDEVTRKPASDSIPIQSIQGTGIRCCCEPILSGSSVTGIQASSRRRRCGDAVEPSNIRCNRESGVMLQSVSPSAVT